MITKEYEPIASSSDPNFDLENINLDGGDHLLVVQAVNEEGEVSEYSDEVVYTQEHSLYAIEKTTLTAIADSVRAKTGKTDPIPTEDLPSEIANIMSGVTAEEYDGSFSVNGDSVSAAYELSGLWLFNDTIHIQSTIGYDISFMSRFTQFDYFMIDVDGLFMAYGYGSYDDGGDDYLVIYSSDAGWTYGTEYKSINFGETPITVSQEFYTWFISNANPVGGQVVRPGSSITITYNGITNKFASGSVITIPCDGKMMTSDIVISLE